MAVFNETGISVTHRGMSIFDEYESIPIFYLSRLSGWVAMLLQKSLDLRVRVIFFNTEGKLVILGVNGSEGYVFKLVDVYTTREDGRSHFFRRLETFM